MVPRTDRQPVDLVEKRRNRNRVSQRQFRERREKYVKDLEERVKFFTLNQNERDAKLSRDYDALCNTLQKTRGRLEQLRNSFEQLCATLNECTDCCIGQTEKRDTSGKLTPTEDSIRDSMPLDKSTTYLEEEASPEHSLDADDCVYDNVLIPADPDRVPSAYKAQMGHGYLTTSENALDLDAFICNIDANMHDVAGTVGAFLTGAHLEQPPLQINVADPMSSSCSPDTTETFGSSLLISLDTKDSRSLRRLYYLLDQEFSTPKNASLSISGHIDRALVLLRDYLKFVGGWNSYSRTSEACLVFMIVFARYISPLPAAMWFSSYCYSLVEKVLFWQVHQERLFGDIANPAYEPSALQLDTKHSSIIDWIVIPGLRDRFITYYNESVVLDDVFIDLMKHTVVEVADLSRILTDAPAGPGYLGVWNLYDAMNVQPQSDVQAVCMDDAVELRDNAFPGLIQMHKLPPPTDAWVCRLTCAETGFWQPVSLGELLGSSGPAKQLYHHLRVYDAHKHWKIDPEFFRIYPKLKYEGFESSCAQGTSYLLTSNWTELSTLS